MTITPLKTNKVGIMASALCMVHCFATPFIFIAKSCSATCCEASPIWWSSMDYLFLVVSLFAIHQSTKKTSNTWITYAMWTSWFSLLTILLNENIQLFSIVESAIYLPAITLVILHIYNLRYCKCQMDKCCAN